MDLRLKAKGLGFRALKTRLSVPKQLCSMAYADWGLYKISSTHADQIGKLFFPNQDLLSADDSRLLVYDFQTALPSLVGYYTAFFREKSSSCVLASPLNGYRETRAAAIALSSSLDKLLLEYNKVIRAASALEDMRDSYDDIDELLDFGEKTGLTSNLFPPLPNSEKYENDAPNLKEFKEQLRCLSDAFKYDNYRMYENEDCRYLDYWLKRYEAALAKNKGEAYVLKCHEVFVKMLVKQFSKQRTAMGVDVQPEAILSLSAKCKELTEVAKRRGGQPSDFMQQAFIEKLASVFDHFSIWWRKGINENKYKSRRLDFIEYGMELAGIKRPRSLLSRPEIYCLTLPPSVISDLLPT